MNYTQEEMALIEQFKELANKTSQRNASTTVGLSTTVGNQLVNGTFEGDKEKQFNKLRAYFKLEEERQELYKAEDYIKTSVSENVYKDIRYCQVKGGLVTIVGDSGIGKTRGIRKFVKENSNKAVRITADPIINSKRAILIELCDVLGLEEASNLKMRKSIQKKLNSGDVIIVDEAQHLTLVGIEILRGIVDSFKENEKTLGVVFVGNDETMDRFGGRKKSTFAQIDNRIILKSSYKRKDITNDDIEALFPLLEDEKSKEFMLNIVHSEKAIRGAQTIFENAYNNGNYTYKGLVASAKGI